MLGKWDNWYKDIKTRKSFGDKTTYKLAANFLADIDEVEDWGCGTGYFKQFYKGKYIGVDGTDNLFVDKVVDLRTYQSNVDGILMRHVLEHNHEWQDILSNAVASFNKKLCLIIFTPFTKTTQEIAHNKKHGVDVPDISFSKKDIQYYFKNLKWRLQENIKTRKGYGVEYIYYIEK
jgi:thioredoxin reductase